MSDLDSWISWIQKQDRLAAESERKGRVEGKSIYAGKLMAHAANFRVAIDSPQLRRVRVVRGRRDKTSDSFRELADANAPTELVDSLVPFKTCSLCRKDLPHSAFSTNQASKPGGSCKKCMQNK